ncbi:hypothetical protein CSAL01_05044 [Colletotrichum salicis]|uniref:Uncharacterized protein n=1 Tax=Colletotrichum salicis TaxID=1209931 RepID=A0A135S2Q7_9PEZI|nr:hypothetical protein CSAL01_05044 [Colletotrichum salicis]
MDSWLSTWHLKCHNWEERHWHPVNKMRSYEQVSEVLLIDPDGGRGGPTVAGEKDANGQWTGHSAMK